MPFLPSHGLCISSSKKSHHETRRGVLKIFVREQRIFFLLFYDLAKSEKKKK